MAYNRNRVIIYGIAGILLALTILNFIPTHTETHVTTGVNLDDIPGYGIQIVKISEDNVQITNLVLKISSIEAMQPDGEWVIIASNVQWDLWREVEKIIPIDQGSVEYTKLRLNIAQDSTVTLSGEKEIQLGVQSQPLEIDMGASTSTGTGKGLRLSLSQGKASNYILPNLQIEISTNRLTAEITDQ